MFRSEIGSGFEDPGGTPHKEFRGVPPPPPRAWKKKKKPRAQLSSVTIDAEFVGGIEVLEVQLVAVDAAEFRMSLVCRFPMASSACVAMRTRRISVECLHCWQPSLFECCLPAAAIH